MSSLRWVKDKALKWGPTCFCSLCGVVWTQTNEDAALRLSYLKVSCCFPEMPSGPRRSSALLWGLCSHRTGRALGTSFPSFFSEQKEGCKWGNMWRSAAPSWAAWAASSLGNWGLGLLSCSRLSRLAGGRFADADYPGYNSQEDLLLKIWDAWVAQLANKHLPSAPVVIPGSGDRARHQVPWSAGSLLLPLPPAPLACVPSFSLWQITK